MKVGALGTYPTGVWLYIVHRVSKVNQHVDGLNQNPSTNEDITRARWHGDIDLEAILIWHAFTYLCIVLEHFGNVPHNGMDNGDFHHDQDIKLEGNGVLDIHEDIPIIASTSMWSSNWVTLKEQNHIMHRAKRFKWEGNFLVRVWTNGWIRVLPCRKECESLVQHAHEELGHFGIQCTCSLFQTQYWWQGMQLQVQQFVFQCMVCGQVRASVNAPTPQLQPLLIVGLGYQWSWYFASPLSLTFQHNHVFWLWSNIYPSGWCRCQIIAMRELCIWIFG